MLLGGNLSLHRLVYWECLRIERFCRPPLVGRIACRGSPKCRIEYRLELLQGVEILPMMDYCCLGLYTGYHRQFCTLLNVEIVWFGASSPEVSGGVCHRK